MITQPDLFPETLLVDLDGSGQSYTTSLKVAEHFGKRHTDVDSLRNQLAWAEDNVESWRAEAMTALDAAAEAAGGRVGLTVEGRLMVVGPNTKPVSYLDCAMPGGSA